MQPNDVKSFRQRLKRAGFQVEYIYETKPGIYVVRVVSPSGEDIRRELSLLQMRCIPRLVWFD